MNFFWKTLLPAFFPVSQDKITNNKLFLILRYLKVCFFHCIVQSFTHISINVGRSKFLLTENTTLCTIMFQNSDSGDIQPSPPFVNNTSKLHVECVILITVVRLFCIFKWKFLQVSLQVPPVQVISICQEKIK